MKPKARSRKPVKETSEKPLTLKGLETFYQKTIAPQFNRFEGIDNQLKGVQDHVGSLRDQFKGVHYQLEDVRNQFKCVNEKLEEHDRRFNEINNHIDGLYKVIDDLRIEYHALLGGVRRIEENLERDSKEKAEWKKDLSVLKDQVTSLQERVVQLESRL